MRISVGVETVRHVLPTQPTPSRGSGWMSCETCEDREEMVRLVGLRKIRNPADAQAWTINLNSF